MKRQEHANWQMRARLSKYVEDITPFKEDGREAEFHKLFKPYEIIEQKDNCLLNSGCDAIWDLVTGDDTVNIFDYAHTFIGVGDSSTAAAAAQTDLQAETNKEYITMSTGFPASTTQAATFKASFGDAEANFAWWEWVVKETQGAKSLNRKVESLGTKTTGTWTLEVSITLS